MKRLWKWYCDAPVQLKASVWYTFTQVLQKGVGFIIVPLYTRILTADEYGIYSMFNTWLEVMLIFGTLKVYGNSYNVGLAKFSDDRDRYTSATMGVGLVCTALFFLLFCFVPDLFEYWLGMPFAFICLLYLEVLFNPAYNLWAMQRRYDYHYVPLTLVTIAMTIATPVIGIALVYALPSRTLGAVLGKCLPPVIAGAACFFIILKQGKSLYNSKYWRYAISFNLPLIFYYLAQVFLYQMDRIMIQHLESESKVAIYSVANAAAFFLSIVTTAVNMTFIPFMFQKLKAQKQESIKKVSLFIMIMVALLHMCLIVLAPEAMRIMAPESYQEGVWLIPPLVASVFLAFVAQIYCNVEFYYEKKFYLMWTSIFVCLCNVILNYVFISRFGYIAAGYTSLASYILYLAGHMCAVRYIQKKEKEKPVFDNRAVLLICIVFVLFSVMATLLYGHMLLRYGVVMAIIILFIWKKDWIIMQFKAMR
ncbi:MAG: oligosaccharide flippase family protein [Clostridiaceae bacterium]|nr:oligosaccharide flippase family protein [Clostridiaceae bacterium]